MKYKDLFIQTLREAPNNARTPGFSFLVRAGYVTRENQPTTLGNYALEHLESLEKKLGNVFFKALEIPAIKNENDIFFPITTGSLNILYCKSCGYADRSEVARFQKKPLLPEAALPIEKIETPNCNTIEELANYFEVPQTKTAKALLFTRRSDSRLVFAIVRGDMQLSEAKLEIQVGDFSSASEVEIAASGAVAGYASPVGLSEALIVVDDLIPQSANLVAGANESGYHLKNVNYGRDYSGEIISDLALAKADDPCEQCGHPLEASSAECLSIQAEVQFMEILHAAAETHHDERGLDLPFSVAPFDVYLMHIPGRTMDTRATGEEIYAAMRNAGISVLFDDREVRAGIKFNDADLIGCPVRITVGEKNLADEMVELKLRPARESDLIQVDRVVETIQALSKRQ